MILALETLIVFVAFLLPNPFVVYCILYILLCCDFIFSDKKWKNGNLF